MRPCKDYWVAIVSLSLACCPRSSSLSIIAKTDSSCGGWCEIVKVTGWSRLAFRVPGTLMHISISTPLRGFLSVVWRIESQNFGEWDSLVSAQYRMVAPRYFHIAVTCFDSGNTSFLALQASREWASLAARVRVSIITNNAKNPSIQQFIAESTGLEAEIVSHDIVGHPYLLTWIHREIFKKSFSYIQCRFYVYRLYV